jgi:hypothetical protein
MTVATHRSPVQLPVIQGFGRNVVARLTQWTRDNVLAPFELGCLLLITGVWIAFGTSLAWFEQTARNHGFPSPGSGMGEFIAMWTVSLSLLLAGNFFRRIGWSERLRREAESAPQSRSVGRFRQRLSFTDLLNVLVGPIMIFWGGLTTTSIMTYLRIDLWGTPGRGWIFELERVRPQLIAVTVCWLVAVSLLSGGIALLWLGFRSLIRRREPNL